MKRCLSPLLALCLILTLAACGSKEEPAAELDLDQIAAALTASGCFPDSLEEQDPELVPGLLSLYEERIEAQPEDIAQAWYSMALGMVADQFLLLKGTDGKAADRLEAALETYAQDQKSAYEFYNPEQAARMDDPIVERRGVYLLFAVGEDRAALAELCARLMDGETVEASAPQPEVPPEAASEPSQDEDTAAAQTTPESLSSEEVEAARRAALDYYAGTVFEIHSLTPLDPMEGEVMFQTACSKGGEEQPDRTIALERRDGVWTVINEGY